MAKQQSENCSQCAYAQNDGNGLWCPFHDEPVSKQLVCDDFLDEYQAPLYATLADETSKVSLGVIVKDIIAYIMIGGLVLLATICTLGILSQ